MPNVSCQKNKRSFPADAWNFFRFVLSCLGFGLAQFFGLVSFLGCHLSVQYLMGFILRNVEKRSGLTAKLTFF